MRKLFVLLFLFLWVCWQNPSLFVWTQIQTKRIIEAVSQEFVGEIPNDKPMESSSNLVIFARQLAACAKPGPRVRALAGSLSSKRPIEKLKETYSMLRRKWVYKADNGSQHQSAEYSITSQKGDCEDFACLIFSMLKASDDLTCRLVLCRGEKPSEPGHAYCEVLVSSDLTAAEPLLRELADTWKIAKVAYRVDNGIWISLDFAPPTELYRGAPYAYISEDGGVLFAGN